MSRPPLFDIGVLVLLLLPAAHPLLIPLVGVPSHLLWWVHVLPVARCTYRYGARGAVATLLASAVLVATGERLFGAGYGSAADWQTVASLVSALTFTNILVGGFAFSARRHTRRYQLLFSRATIGILSTDRIGRILAVNPLAERLLGRPEAALRRRTVAEALDLPDLPAVRAIEHAGGSSVRLRLPGAGMTHALVVAIEQDEPEGYQVLLMDRSLEAAQEHELDRKTTLAALGEGLAGVAHELKNPLTVICGYAELAAEAVVPAEVQEMLLTIRDAARRMESLVRELLAFSRPVVARESVAIHELLRKILVIERIALGKSVELREDVGWEGEVCASPSKVEQIVLNLISNAADALGPAGGVITVRCRLDGEWAVVEVLDTGAGIAPEVWPSLFQPFVTSKAEGKGTGLGLAISRRLATSMGGTLEAANLEPRGAAFTLHLPRATRPCGEAAPPLEAA